MKNTFILAMLCLISSPSLHAFEAAIFTHKKPLINKDSTQFEKLKTSIKNRKSIYHLELGMTTGPAFFPGAYFGFGYTQKSDKSIRPGFFLNYSSFNLENSVVYYNKFTTLDRVVSTPDNEEYRTYETRIIDYRIKTITLFELGVSAEYKISQKTSIKAVGAFNIRQGLQGDFIDQQADTTYKITNGERVLQSGYQPTGSNGIFTNRSPRYIGIKNYFTVHLGIDQKITKRVGIAARVSLPLSEILPSDIGYSQYSSDDDVTISKQTNSTPDRPLFVKVGLSYTI